MSRIINVDRLVAGREEVVFYPYRRANVLGVVEIHAETEEERRDYRLAQERLCKMVTKVVNQKGELVEPNGVTTPDNHTCFMVGKTAIMFSDWEVRIGTDLVVENW